MSTSVEKPLDLGWWVFLERKELVISCQAAEFSNLFNKMVVQIGSYF